MGDALGALFVVALVVGLIAAWATHVVYCILHGLWIMLLAGALLFPVSIVHGVMCWFGAGVPG